MNFREDIPSAVSQEECQFLYDNAKPMQNAVIVEIGCDYGRSSFMLSALSVETKSTFYTIDDFSYHTEPAKGKFIGNMGDFPYTLMEMTSEEAAKKFDKDIDFLFIDGDHTGPGAELDIKVWLPKVKPGGKVFFHDYGSRSFPGYSEAIDKFMGNYPVIGLVGTVKGYGK